MLMRPVNTAIDRKAAALAFAIRLHELLAELEISQRELARRLSEATGGSFETARTSVYRLLRAEHVPTESTRQQIADALGVERSAFEQKAPSGDSPSDLPISNAVVEAIARRTAEIILAEVRPSISVPPARVEKNTRGSWRWDGRFWRNNGDTRPEVAG